MSNSQPAQYRSKIKVGLIGVGRVGIALLRGLSDKGYSIIGLYDKAPAALERARQVVKGGLISLPPDELAARSDLLFITTPDRAIERVYREIRAAVAPTTILVHCSGALSYKIFESGLPLLLHPLQAFPDHKTRLKPGIYWAVEGDEAAVALGMKLVRDLGGRPFRLAPGSRPLYHAMAVAGSNFLAVILDLAVRLGQEAGIRAPLKILLPLIEETIEQIFKFGPVRALSGPFERGEVGVIKSHLSAIEEHRPELLKLYSALGERACELALMKGSIDKRSYDQMVSILDKF